MKKLILFDIDGTILKARMKLSRQLFSNLFEEVFGKTIDIDAMPDFSGNTDLNIFYEIAEILEISKEDLEAKIPELFEKKVNIFKPFCTPDNFILLDGVEELIEKLVEMPELQIALLTGNGNINAYQKLNVFDLGKFFKFGAFGDKTRERNKLIEVAKKEALSHTKHNFENEDIILIGDSPRDIECAKVNNVKIIAVATGHHDFDTLKRLEPNVLLDDLGSIDEVINTIMSL